MKICSVVILIAMVLTLTAAAASVAGIAVTGFYPGIIVLLLLAPVPVASKIISKSDGFKKAYYLPLIIINLLTILVVLWMTFVILVDRVFGNLL